MKGRMLALVACAALLAAVLSTGSPGETTGAGSAQKVVGEVTKLSGQEQRLRVTGKNDEGSERLRLGDKLHFGDVIRPGQGVKATLELEVPNGVSSSEELVFVRTPEGEPQKITLERITRRTTEVKIEG
jgi:hypothetical protein